MLNGLPAFHSTFIIQHSTFLVYPCLQSPLTSEAIPLDGYKGGWIEIIAGGMFSGKSEELIRRLRRSVIARQRVQVFKPLMDDLHALPRTSSRATTAA